MADSPLWDLWKQGFYAWEGATAKLFESWLSSPSLLEPAGAMLTATMRMKKQADEATARWWAAAGLPTRREQERLLHAVNQLNSRIIDLELRLAEKDPPAGDRGDA